MKQGICAAAAVLIAALAASAYAQTCNSQTVDDAPTSRYQANADGTATDLQTGLMWMRCAAGQAWDATNSTCTGQATTYDWQAALQAAQTLDQGSGFAGYNDWRLPSLRELMSIDRYHCTDPAINLTIFPATPSQNFWSSSPLEAALNTAWTLDFGTGSAIDEFMQSSYAIRLVRAGAFDNKLPSPVSSAAAAAVINYQSR